MQYFNYTQLPPHLQEISKPFCVLAAQVADRGGQPAEVTVALRKLLEAKDAAVRSQVRDLTAEEIDAMIQGALEDK